MILVRRTLASPLYLLAFMFHLLCAFFTWAAQYISGDDFKERDMRLPIIVIAMLSAGVIIVKSPPHDHPLSDDRLKIVGHPTEYGEVKLPYTEAEMTRVLPYLKLTACIFAQEAVRYSLRPDSVSFVACPHTSDFNIVFSQDLTDVTVSGLATVDGLEKPFTATLQHYPTATEIDGYQTIAIKVSDEIKMPHP